MAMIVVLAFVLIGFLLFTAGRIYEMKAIVRKGYLPSMHVVPRWWRT